MSADDPKRRRQGHTKPPSLDDEAPAEGAFFRAPTKAFQALPTEVLDVGSGPRADVPRTTPEGAAPTSESMSDPRVSPVPVPAPGTRATRLPASLFEGPPSDEPAFPSPPPTEALGADEVLRLTRRHAAIDDAGSDALDLTNPEPFRVDLAAAGLDSDERALLEVAREPTQHDLHLEDLGGPVSETSTDVVTPKPVSGLMHLGAGSTDGGFEEDNTLALDEGARHARVAAAAPSPFSEPTDEDAAMPSEPGSLALEPALPAPSLPQDRYYRELRDAIGAARVFDPKRPTHAVTDPGFREDSDEWPEITLDPAPRPKPPVVEKRRRFPLALAAFLASALVVTVGGVGIGFSLSKRGVHLDDVLASVGLGDPPPKTSAAGGSASGADVEGREGVEASPKQPAPIDPAGAWRGKTVQVYFANVDDASRAGTPGLADTLLQAFTSALASDEHAAWRVASSRPRRGYRFDASLAVLSVDEGDDGTWRVRCALNADRLHKPGGDVRVSVSAARRAEGSLAGADAAKVAREASRACGFALALAFFPPALAEAP